MTPDAVVLPELRPELTLHAGPMRFGDRNWVIYDPIRHRYFQVSHDAFALLKLWKAGEIDVFRARVETQLDRCVDASEIEALTTFLFANNLTLTPAGGDVLNYARQIKRQHQGVWQRMMHQYLFFRVPLCRPHRFLEATLPVVEPLYSRFMFWIVVVLSVVGLYLTARQWNVFSATFVDFLSPSGLLAYGVALVALKILHELGHAYTATRAGVRVNTMGVAFMLLMPILFTDVSDASRLRSRQQKVAIAGAGMAVELAIAGIATFIWAFLPDGPMRSVAFVVATTSWILSLMINLNPLMRFDGYYLLADAWGIENLQSRSFAIGRWKLREALFGLEAAPPEVFPIWTRFWLIVYAFATWIYRLFLFIGIALLVYHLFFKAAGLLLFIVEIFWFIGRPILSELSEWWKMKHDIAKRGSSWITVLVFLGTLVGLSVPWSATVYVPAVAVSSDAFEVFPPRSARVVDLRFETGTVAEAGMPLMTLASPDLEFEIAATKQKIALSEARLLRVAGDLRDRATRMITEQELVRSQAKLVNLEKERERLEVVAPHAGVVTDTLSGLNVGDWVDAETRIARVVSTRALEAHGYIHEDDVWKVDVGQAAVFVPEDPLLASRRGRVGLVSEAGAEDLKIRYLSTVFGGAVPSDAGDDGEIKPRSGRYFLQVELNGEPMQRVVRGTVLLDGHPESILPAAWRRVMQVLVREMNF
ncbi:MAG: HlyD family efflux transporter periplasmic adaptor subunit [Pseudomonadota bacterium]